jgi:hypothetical protein
MSRPDDQPGLTSGLPSFQGAPNHQFEARIRENKRSGGRQAIVGAVLIVAGVGISVESYLAAGSDGRYGVFTGLILVGLFLLVRGLARRRSGD